MCMHTLSILDALSARARGSSSHSALARTHAARHTRGDLLSRLPPDRRDSCRRRCGHRGRCVRHRLGVQQDAHAVHARCIPCLVRIGHAVAPIIGQVAGPGRQQCEQAAGSSRSATRDRARAGRRRQDGRPLVSAVVGVRLVAAARQRWKQCARVSPRQRTRRPPFTPPSSSRP